MKFVSEMTDIANVRNGQPAMHSKKLSILTMLFEFGPYVFLVPLSHAGV